MAFEGLSERLQNAISGIGAGGTISEADLRQMMREIRLALLEADVNFQVVKSFVKTVNERALGSDVLASLSPAQQVVKIVDEELTALMGGEQVPLNFATQPPTIIMMAGLQGAGKTTTVGKLAKYVQAQGKKRPLLVAGDIYRPAAIAQLQTIGQQLGFDVFSLGSDVSPVEIACQAVAQARIQGNDVVLIDTAGRLHVDETLMEELRQIKAAVNPHEILLTVDAMTGQDAVNVAKAFNDSLDITGVIITKLDGDTRGGAALSIRSIIDRPIKFTGQGEKLDALEPFYPDRMSSRILGMGDMLTLIEKASQEYDEKKSLEMAEKMRENTFDFNDFIDQLDQVQGMGPMEDLLKLIQGMANNPALKNIKVDEKEIARKRAIVSSMTPAERENPDLLSPSRRRRIANGSGNSFVDVNKFIKDFNQAKHMMQGVLSGDMSKMMKQMGLNPNNMPKNMPGGGGMPDMSALEGMMGQGGMPDMSGLGGAGMPDMSQMFGGGLKGKAGEFLMRRSMNKMAKQMKKNKKKRK